MGNDLRDDDQRSYGDDEQRYEKFSSETKGIGAVSNQFENPWSDGLPTAPSSRVVLLFLSKNRPNNFAQSQVFTKKYNHS